MAGGTGTTIIGNDSNTEAGAPGWGAVTAERCYYYSMAAAATGTPDTAWVKFHGTSSSVRVCVWNASRTLLIASNVFDKTTYSTVPGVWNQQPLATTAELTASTSYFIGVFLSDIYVQIRASGSSQEWPYTAGGTTTWPTAPSTLPALSGSTGGEQPAIYLSVEGSASPKSRMLLRGLGSIGQGNGFGINGF